MKVSQRDVASGLFLVFLAGLGMWLNMDHTMGTARRMGPGYMPWMVFVLQALLGALVIFTSFTKRSPGDAPQLTEGMNVAKILAVLSVVAGLWIFLQGEINPPFQWDNATMFALFGLAMLAGGIGLWVGGTGDSEALDRWTQTEVASFALGIAAGFGTWWVLRTSDSWFGQTYNAVGTGMLVGFVVVAWAPGWRFFGLINASMCLFGLLLEKMGFFVALTGIILMACVAEREHLKRPVGILGTLVFLLVMCWVIFINRLDIRVNLWPQL